MLEKVISGAQTGVDQAALFAAKQVGIPTGGYVTKGCRTTLGCDPGLISMFGLVELNTLNYRDRTRRNVKESDATLRIAEDFETFGERCTARAIMDYKKPWFDFHLLAITLRSAEVPKAVTWIKNGKFKVLNVAGNSEKTCPGIYKAAFEFLSLVFERVKKS